MIKVRADELLPGDLWCDYTDVRKLNYLIISSVRATSLAEPYSECHIDMMDEFGSRMLSRHLCSQVVEILRK